ncbi:hypothetical protein ACEUZ9_002873 [Paracoccus litorisediminis]|uniref:hypothetical protein n=1 Tax=Paracoccus litorisediminis TaxID=2006130 RepID=UPI00372E5399
MKKARAKRIKRPKHKGEIRAWKFALRKDQDVSRLHQALDVAWSVRNDLAAERAENGKAIRAAKREGRVPPARVTKRDQEMRLAERRKRDRDGVGSLHSLVVKNVVDRIDEGWRRFWEALAEGRRNVRPPSPVKRERYRSLTYPQYGNGVRIKDGCVELSMLGRFRLHDHRKIRGRIQTVTVKWAHGRWWCIVTTLVQAALVYRAAPQGAVDTGADPGLTALMTFSDGSRLDPPRALDLNLGKLRHAQKDLSRKFEMKKRRQADENRLARAEGREAVKLALSNRLKRQIRRVGKIHSKVVNIRDHWHKLGARRTEQRFARVACEEHGVLFMIRNRRLARSASDRAISGQKQALASALGPRLVMVANQRPGIGGNSQSCLCGAPVPKTLRERWHHCPRCGLSAPRDQVAANICQTIGFGTNALNWTPGRGSSDVEGATAQASESVPATGDEPVRAPAEKTGPWPARAPSEASTSGFLGSVEQTACGFGLKRKTRLEVIDPRAVGTCVETLSD